MKSIINMTTTKTDTAILIARVGIAALMLTHGIPKLMMLFSNNAAQFPGVMGMSPEISLGLAVFAEALCSMLLLVGFGTRLALIPLIVTMLTASMLIHQADPFAVKESSLQYLLMYVVLFFSGGGKYSLDNLLLQNKANVSKGRVVEDVAIS